MVMDNEIEALGAILYVTGYCEKYEEREEVAKVWLRHDSIARAFLDYAAAVRKERDDEIQQLREACLDADIELHNSGLEQGARMEREKWSAVAQSIISDWNSTRLSGVKRGHLSALDALIEEAGL